MFYLDEVVEENVMVVLWALHGFLVPTKSNNTKKYSIRDSQESFFFLAESTTQIDEHLNFLKSRQISIQPFVIGIGENLFKIDKFYVYLDGMKFNFNTGIRAIDICFKSFFLFKLKYPEASENFWNFIQRKFYGIEKGKINTKTALILNHL